MTRVERFTQLAAIQRTHDVMTCHILACPLCAKYYRVLFTPDQDR